MDNETKEFLTKLVGALERSLRQELAATETRILVRTDELIAEAKTELLNSMNQWRRTRDARILAVEFRVAEVEKRLDQIQPGS